MARGSRSLVGVGIDACWAVMLGVVIGLMSGYLLGWFDLIMQRIIDVMQALPLLVHGAGDGGVARAIAGKHDHRDIDTAWCRKVARVVRSSTLSLREMPFVEAAPRHAG